MATQSMGTTGFHSFRVRDRQFTLLFRAQFSRARRSAVRAQKAISRSDSRRASKNTTAQTEKVIQTVKRRRKQRYNRLREMVQGHEDDMLDNDRRGRGEIVCPVCLKTVFGDPDVTEAHVDACLIHAMPSARDLAEIDIGGPSRTRVTDGANLTGLNP